MTRERKTALGDQPSPAGQAGQRGYIGDAGGAARQNQEERAAGEGLSIRPHLLRLSPYYRRLRDSILRPHLRLTESRYFWEKWKPRLGADATVLIMEVRDRCNRVLAHPPDAREAGPGRSGGLVGWGGWDGLAGSGTRGAFAGSDRPAPGNGEHATEGTTVSAVELAAACGFSRVTLWRLLQREDVRQFVRVEHNYVYDRRIGKKRRTVSTYHVLMEDPLVPEDEPRLEALLGAQTVAPPPVARAEAALPTPAAGRGPSFQTETEVVDNPPPRFHSAIAESGSSAKPENVPETKLNQRLARTPLPHAPREDSGGQPSRLSTLLDGLAQLPPDSAPGPAGARRTAPGGAVDIWKKYPEFAHHVEEIETLLGDRHSRGFYISALKKLYPQHMGLWQRALGLAREQTNIRRSRGALFTRLVRTFAAEAGVQL